MKKHIFGVVGTDTNVGKTIVCAALLHAYNQEGLTTLGIKPVATGVDVKNILPNEDAYWLKKFSSMQNVGDIEISPFRFEPPISPHLAAQQIGKPLVLDRIAGVVKGSLSHRADVTILEGTGGWFCPLNMRYTMGDLFKQLKVNIIIVVPIRLGCFNHTLLTQAAIRFAGLNVLGWVANFVEATPEHDQIVESLKQFIDAPYLGYIAYQPNTPILDIIEQAHLDISLITN